MREQKGVVMKISGSHAIVMTRDRQFLRIPAQEGMRIGQEVSVPKAVTMPVWGKRIGIMAASLALALGVWQAASLLQPNQVSAYVAIDINPSLELAIDDEAEVLQATPLNQDGEKLIANLNLKGKPVQEAVNELATEAAKQGYVKPDGEIIVTASSTDNAKMDIQSLEHNVITSVQETLKQNGLQTNVGGVVVTEDVREEAKKVGLSPGKYAVYLQAKASGIDVSVDELKQGSVSTVTKQHGQDMEEIVHGMKDGKRLDELLKQLSGKKPASAKGNNEDDDNKKNGNDRNSGDQRDKKDANDKEKNDRGKNGQDNEKGNEKDKNRNNENDYKNDRDKDKDKDRDKDKDGDKNNRGRDRDQDRNKDNSRNDNEKEQRQGQEPRWFKWMWPSYLLQPDGNGNFSRGNNN